MVSFYVRYVPHDKVDSYRALGWVVEQAFAPCHHCRHAAVMRYRGDLDPPPEPKEEK